MRTTLLLVGLALVLPAPAVAEWQIKPFVGITFGGGTTFVDIENAAPRPHRIIGVTGVLLGEVFGLDADFGRSSGSFQSGDQALLLGSSTTTFAGDFIVAVPRRLAQYSLRPYFVAGAGLMHVQIDGRLGALRVVSTLPAVNLGAGVTGFLTRRIGVSWEARRFGSFGGKNHPSGTTFVGDEQLSFWRANMAVAIRY